MLRDEKGNHPAPRFEWTVTVGFVDLLLEDTSHIKCGAVVDFHVVQTCG